MNGESTKKSVVVVVVAVRRLDRLETHETTEVDLELDFNVNWKWNTATYWSNLAADIFKIHSIWS